MKMSNVAAASALASVLSLSQTLTAQAPLQAEQVETDCHRQGEPAERHDPHLHSQENGRRAVRWWAGGGSHFSAVGAHATIS